MEDGILRRIKEKKPLIHCITNYVTANDVANIILAAGGQAVMADGEKEAEDVVSICQGLVINMGTLKEETLPAMIKAGKKANELNIPVVFDPVGAGASQFRTEACKKVFENVQVSLVRGNASEIKALAKALEGTSLAEEEESGRTRGVDVSAKDKVTERNLEKNIGFAENFAKTRGGHGIIPVGIIPAPARYRREAAGYNAGPSVIVLMTGDTDIVTDGRNTLLVKNGTSMMARITGAGCMLDGLTALFLAAAGKEGDVYTAALAAAAEGYCGQMAEERMQKQNELFPLYPAGTGSFRTYLIDGISCLTDEKLKEGKKIEIWKR